MSSDTPVIASVPQILAGVNVVLHDKYVYELRALGAERRGTISGYYDGEYRQEMAEDAARLSADAEGVYVTINPVRRDLLARASNRYRDWAKHTTSDTDILGRRWIPCDFDPVRPSGISSTDQEHSTAIERAGQCALWLADFGFSAGSLVVADSGNGAHILIRVRLENTSDNTELVRRCIEALAFKFNDAAVEVDRKTFNASRIFKVYGTVAAKGDDVPQRPHRVAQILWSPPKLQVAPISLLEKLAGLLPVEPKRQVVTRQTGRGQFAVAQWIIEHNLPVVAEQPWNGGRLWKLNPCPWNSEHKDRAAYIVQFPDGAVAAGCHHNSCAGKDWHGLRDLVEPGWRDRHVPRPAVGGIPGPILREFEKARRARKSRRRGL